MVVGNTSTETLAVSNTGNAPLTLESLTLKSQQFEVTGPSVPHTILPNQSANYSVSFAPTASGNETASLQITTNISNSPVAVSLAGQGEKALAALQITPASINFGDLNLKSTSSQSVTLKNTGDINMTLSGITVVGAGFGYSNLSPGYSLAPNQTVTFQVWFKPQTAGSASGTVTILSSNASPEAIPVSGKGVNSTAPPPEGALSLSSTSFNFNTVVVGNTSTETLQVSNTGNAPLTLESLTLKSQQFEVTGPSVPHTILPNQSANYSVSFAPTASGNETASLQITTNISNSPVAVSLAGQGEKAFAALQITPASINFGNLHLKSTSSQNVTLKNTGDINMTLSGITVVGAGFGYSNLSPGYSLAPNQTITFQVWFKPQTAGSASGTVAILSSNIASPGNIPVAGEGVNSTTAPTPHTVALAWQPSTSPVNGYRVYRSTVPGSGFSPLTSAINVLSYTDNTVADGATYYYVVTAIDALGDESPYSNQVIAVIPAS